MSVVYDSHAGLAYYLTQGLAGLGLLVRDRRAARARGESLTPWIICGAFYLDRQGSLLRIIHPAVAAEQVMTAEAYHGLHAPGHTLSLVGATLPAFGAICDWCGVGWYLDNAHDAIHCDDRLRHRACATLATLVATQALFESYFHDVDPLARLRPIPNRYAGSQSTPWFRVMSGPLQGLICGWRECVINLDWAACAFTPDAATLTFFRAEDTTLGDTYVHAWGYVKLQAYLGQLVTSAQGGSA